MAGRTGREFSIVVTVVAVVVVDVLLVLVLVLVLGVGGIIGGYSNSSTYSAEVNPVRQP